MELQYLLNSEAAEDVIVEISAENHLKIAQHLSALANTNGGYIVIGVNNKLKIKGCEPSSEFSNLNSAVEEFLSLEIELNTELIQEGPKLVLVIQVGKLATDIVQVTSFLGKDQIFIRKDKQTVLANKIIEQVLRLKLQNAFINNEDSYVRQEVEELLNKSELSLSQIYSSMEFEKKIIDATLVQMLFFNEIDYHLNNEVIHFFRKN